MNKFGSLFGAVILALASLPVSASLVTYDNFMDWNDAVSGDIITESFNAPSTPDANTLDITFDGGIRSVASDGRSTFNQVVGGEYKGRVGVDGFSEDITWMFPETLATGGTFGFFGLFRNVDRLDVVVDGFTEMVLLGSEGGFGITSTNPFSSFNWKLFGDSPNNDLFFVNEFSYVGTDSVSPVPAPAALWLFGTGLLGLIGFSRRSKAV
jgi:hypothetical protein